MSEQQVAVPANLEQQLQDVRAKFETVNSLNKAKDASINSLANDLAQANAQIGQQQAALGAFSGALVKLKELAEGDTKKVDTLKGHMSEILYPFFQEQGNASE